MAAEHDVQFYSVTLDFDIGEWFSNVNFNFHKIINSYPVAYPHMNDGYESVFWQNRREHGNKRSFGLRKRAGFTECFDVPWYHITDVYNHDGIRYALAVSDDGNRKKIFKQCYANVKYGCYSDTSESACEGEWKDITPQTLYNHPCIADNIVPLKGPIGKSKYQGIKWVMANVLVGDAVISVLYELNSAGERKKIDINAGDWVYVFDDASSRAVVWQSLQASGFNQKNNRIEFGEKFWSGITTEITEFDEEAGITEYSERFVHFKIFEEYGNSFVIATADGVLQWNWDTCDDIWSNSEFTLLGETKFESSGWEIQNKWFIKSMTNYDWGLVYITNNWYLIHNHPAGILNQSMHGTSYSMLSTIEWRDVLLPVQDYIVMFGPSSVGIAYKTGLNEKGIPTRQFQKIINDIGYFSRDAVLNFREQVYFVDQDARFWRVVITPYDTWLNSVRFQVEMSDMSTHWVNTDFRMMNRKAGDKISLYKTDFEVLVFMTDNRDNTQPANTKILVFDDEYKFWHWRMVPGLNIKHYKDWCWYWDKIFKNEWTTDNGQPIKQIISMNFGESSIFTMKELVFLKTALWYHSRITKDSLMKISVDTGGYRAVRKIKHLYRTKYLWRLNTLRKSWLTEKEIEGKFFHGMPGSIWVFSGNGVWLIENVTHNLHDEFNQFKNYEDREDEEIPCCDDEVEFWNPNFDDDRDQWYFKPSKYAVIKTNLWMQVHNLHVEFIANNDDEIEFLGWFLGWMFMDNSMEYLENNTDYPTTPKLSKLPWKYIK